MEQLTKREFIALDILKAFIQNIDLYHNYNFEELTEHSVTIADLLIKSLEEYEEED